MSKDKIETPANLVEALIELQSKIEPPAKKNENEAFKRGGKASKYADLGAIWDSVKPHLKDLGLFISQPTEITATGMMLRTVVTHKSGEKIESTYLLNPVKQDPQGMGSAITYARRYSLCALLGLVADDDDDGNAASGHGKQKEKTEQELADEAEATYKKHKAGAEALVLKIEAAKSVAELDTLCPTTKRHNPTYPYQDLLGMINVAFLERAEQLTKG